MRGHLAEKENGARGRPGREEGKKNEGKEG